VGYIAPFTAKLKLGLCIALCRRLPVQLGRSNERLDQRPGAVGKVADFY
jgi:hypothetical protein